MISPLQIAATGRQMGAELVLGLAVSDRSTGVR